MIAAGGYGPGLIAATARYTSFLAALANDPGQRHRPLAEILGPDLAAGHLHWFAPYAAVHAQNLTQELSVRAR